MAAYLIVEHRITDPAKFEDYRSKVGPMIARHGERYLTKGGTHKILRDYALAAGQSAIIKFPTWRRSKLGTVRRVPAINCVEKSLGRHGEGCADHG